MAEMRPDFNEMYETFKKLQVSHQRDNTLLGKDTSDDARLQRDEIHETFQRSHKFSTHFNDIHETFKKWLVRHQCNKAVLDRDTKVEAIFSCDTRDVQKLIKARADKSST